MSWFGPITDLGKLDGVQKLEYWHSQTTQSAWAVDYCQGQYAVISGSQPGLVLGWRKDDTARGDTGFMVHAHNVVPALINELRLARACVDMLRAAYDAGAVHEWFDAEDDGGLMVLDAYDAGLKP